MAPVPRSSRLDSHLLCRVGHVLCMLFIWVMYKSLQKMIYVFVYWKGANKGINKDCRIFGNYTNIIFSFDFEFIFFEMTVTMASDTFLEYSLCQLWFSALRLIFTKMNTRGSRPCHSTVIRLITCLQMQLDKLFYHQNKTNTYISWHLAIYHFRQYKTESISRGRK